MPYLALLILLLSAPSLTAQQYTEAPSNEDLLFTIEATPFYSSPVSIDDAPPFENLSGYALGGGINLRLQQTFNRKHSFGFGLGVASFRLEQVMDFRLTANCENPFNFQPCGDGFGPTATFEAVVLSLPISGTLQLVGDERWGLYLHPELRYNLLLSQSTTIPVNTAGPDDEGISAFMSYHLGLGTQMTTTAGRRYYFELTYGRSTGQVFQNPVTGAGVSETDWLRSSEARWLGVTLGASLNKLQ